MTDAPLLRFLGHPHSNISTPNESQILQALKSFGTGFLELQMKVVSTSQYKFSTKSYLEHSALSTYNIRRWDWNSIRERRDYDFSVKSKLDAGVENIGDSNRDEEHTMDAGRILWDRTQDDWESRTVYVVSLLS